MLFATRANKRQCCPFHALTACVDSVTLLGNTYWSAMDQTICGVSCYLELCLKRDAMGVARLYMNCSCFVIAIRRLAYSSHLLSSHPPCTFLTRTCKSKSTVYNPVRYLALGQARPFRATNSSSPCPIFNQPLRKKPPRMAAAVQVLLSLPSCVVLVEKHWLTVFL